MGKVADKVADQVAKPDTFAHTATSSFVSFGIYAGISALVNRFIIPDASRSSKNTQPSIFINEDIPIGVRKIIYGTRKVGGHIVYRWANDREEGRFSGDQPTITDNGFLDIIIVLAGHECEAVEKFYINDEEVTPDSDGYVSDYGVWFEVRLGGANQTPLSRTANIGNTGGSNEWSWSNQHLLNGCCYVHARTQRSTYSNVATGFPIFNFLVKGKKLYDPRTMTTSFSNNPALVLNDYLTENYGVNLSNDFIDQDTLIASANTCEEQVQLIDGSYQNRYTCDIVIDRSATIRTIIAEIESCLGAPRTYSQGKFFINAGDYTTPIVTIDEDWFISRIDMVTRMARRDLINTVRGVYIDPDLNYSATDFPEVSNSVYVEQDGGEKFYLDIELPGILNSEQAQRIAKIILEKARQGITFQVTMNLRALQLKVWDIVNVNFEPFGWEEKVFRVTEWELLSDTKGIRCTFQEESEASYEWNRGEATERDPAPDTTLADPLTVDRVFITSITEELYETTGGFASQAVVVWQALEDSLVVGYRLSYRHEDDEDFIERPIITGTRDVIQNLRLGQYTFRLIAINSYDVESTPTLTTYELRGVVANPQRVRNLEYDIISGNIHLRWEKATRTDLDVLIGGAVVIRHTHSTNGTWTNAIEIGRLAGNSTEFTAPYRNGTYLAKFEDQGGRQSLRASSVVAIGENIVTRNQIIELIEDDGFPGDTANMAVTSEGLEMERTNTWDDQTGNWDDQEGNFDEGGGLEYETAGVYIFDNLLDAGRVIDMNIRVELEFTASYVEDTWDRRSGTWDEQEGLFDGGDRNLATVVPTIQVTDEDPSTAHSLEFTNRGILTAGDFRARGAQFELSVQTISSNVRVIITRLRIIADVPDIIQRGNYTGEAIPHQITFDREFYDRPSVVATNLDGFTNHVVTISSVTRSGFLVSVHNVNNNNLVPVNIAWLAGGY